MARAKKPAGVRTNSGKKLNEQWRIGAAHALYHRDGTWFNVLEKFPGALCDPNGYVLFSTKSEYENAPDVNVAQQTNVPGGIHRLSGYVRMAE
ncbi:hypothetical protein NKH53_31495 [Mesorhizobium australicum]|uniref:hypothetical protein n=1 Tax=Mesorhizobium australicum TaxID=536018 RepID=UPI0033387A6A